MVIRVGRPPTCDCGRCRKCKHREYMRAWYQRKTLDERRAWIARRDRELVRKRDRERHERDKDKRLAAAAEYRKTAAGRDAMRRAQSGYRLRYPDKYAAHVAFGNARRDGRVVRQPCEACGSTEGIEGHHDDYSKPLDVRWLCRFCHREIHAALRKRVS